MAQNLRHLQKPHFGSLRTDAHWSVQGLLAFWSFAPAAGQLIDLSPHKRHGTLTGDGLTWQGSGLKFGGTDDYVDCGVSPMPGKSAITVETWVKRGAVADEMVAEDGTNFDQNTFYLVMDKVGAEVLPQFEIYTVAFDAVQSSIDVPADTWWHIVGTWQNGTLAKIYINGVLDSAATQSGSLRAQNLKATVDSNLFIGGRPASPLSIDFSGTVGLFRLWDRQLLASEIQHLYVDPWTPIDRGAWFLGKSVVGEAANPKGPLGHPLYGALAGPIAV